MMTNKTVNKSHLNGSGTPAASAAGGATTTEQPAAEPQAVPNPEATPKAKRRSFSAAYKKRILKEKHFYRSSSFKKMVFWAYAANS